MVLKVKIAAQMWYIGQNFGCALACINCLLHRSCDISQEATKGLKFALCKCSGDYRPSPPSSKFLSGNLHPDPPEHLTRRPVSKLTTLADHTCSGVQRAHPVLTW